MQKYEAYIRKIGLKIKDLRINQRVTQEQLAALCDIDTRTIQRIEKGQQNISLNILFSIADSLNVSPDELIKDLKE